MMSVQCCMLLQKTVEYKLGVKLKKKWKPEKKTQKKQGEKLILKRKLKQWEERCQYLTK